MAKKKYDAVLAAVRYDEIGQVEIARIFERRGVIFSDHFHIDRKELIKRIKDGQKFMTGSRQYKMGSVFDVNEEVRVVSSNGKDVLVEGSGEADKDTLKSVPHF